MRRPSAFLSSTYRDLRFERRFVCELLKRRGFDVVTMEEHYRPEFDWERWSMNRAGQCDVLVQLLADRVGTSAFSMFIPMSITMREGEHARAYGVEVIASYELNRPFPDAERLYSPGEAEEYQKTLDEKDTRVKAEAAMLERTFRMAVPIHSVGELEAHLLRDTQMSRRQLMRHRWRLWSKAYWDTTRAAWLRAFEDESHVASTHRSFLWRHLRAGAWLGGLAILLLAWRFSLLWAVVALVAGAMLWCLAVLAWAPSFCWIGTKTIMARGMFGIRTIQQPRTEPFRGVYRWRLLERFTGLEAVTIHFALGKKIFVPLIDNSGLVVPMLDRSPHAPSCVDGEKTVYPDFDVATREFAEMLLREDEAESVQEPGTDSDSGQR